MFLNDDKNPSYQMLQEAVKVVCKGNFISLKVYVRNDKRLKINELCCATKEHKKI